MGVILFFRFNRKIYIELPDQLTRINLIKINLNEINHNLTDE